MTDAFDRVTFRGHLMDKKTQAFLEAIEARLGYELTVLQGCYNPGGVAASGGTHDGGGVVDLAPADHERKVHAARALGAFAWFRPAIPGLWGDHVHLGIRDHGRLSHAAQSQQVDYDATPPLNGLASHAPDPSWHPSPSVTFQYAPKPEPPKTSALSHIHASGRFDATVEQVTAAWDKFRSTRGVQIITGTEHGSGEHDAAFEADGWDYVRLGECVVSWDATELEPAWKPSLTLIGSAYFRGGNENSRTKLLSVPLRHLASGRVFMVRVAHTPAHVQAGNGFRKTTARVIRQAAGWATGLVAWGRKSRRFRRSHPNAAEVSVADWNVDLHRRHWRALIRKSLRLTCAHGRHLPERGDLGRRLVSWFFLRGVEVIATAVLNAVDGYDHRPVIAHLSIKHKEHA